MAARLQGQRVVLTEADVYMGPAVLDLFREEGAEVLADTRDLREPGAGAWLIEEAGHVDVLVANMAPTIDHLGPAEAVTDEVWHYMFDRLVTPLFEMCSAVLPQMIARRRGKIVVYGSITGLRYIRHASAYATARAAQVGYVRELAGAIAAHNLQINLVAQHWVESETFFPEALQQTEAFREWLKECPSGRLAKGREDALLGLFLATARSDFITGAAIPFTGGWHL